LSIEAPNFESIESSPFELTFYQNGVGHVFAFHSEVSIYYYYLLFFKKER